jgi:hypothetical protein
MSKSDHAMYSRLRETVNVDRPFSRARQLSSQLEWKSSQRDGDASLNGDKNQRWLKDRGWAKPLSIGYLGYRRL